MTIKFVRKAKFLIKTIWRALKIKTKVEIVGYQHVLESCSHQTSGERIDNEIKKCPEADERVYVHST